jgi:integrase
MPSPPGSPRVRRVKKRLADGTIKTYEYAAPPKQRGLEVAATDSLRDLLMAYERSPEWLALKPRTKAAKLVSLRHLQPVQHLAVADLKRRYVLELRDGIAAGIGPAAANAFTASLASVMAWARDHEWVEHSPADRIKALPGGHLPTWTEDDLSRALDAMLPHHRRALLFAAYTGQRRGDLIAARWTDIAGNVWRLTQEKTGARLVLPLHPDLLAEIATWPRTAVTVLSDRDGRPWRAQTLNMGLMRTLRRIGLHGHNIHGLRKLAAVRLAEAGATVHEIAAITGHASLSQVALYTKEADQARLARSAMVRLAVSKPKA